MGPLLHAGKRRTDAGISHRSSTASDPSTARAVAPPSLAVVVQIPTTGAGESPRTDHGIDASDLTLLRLLTSSRYSPVQVRLEPYVTCSTECAQDI